jgi:peptidoglycan hydrolase-like protein with peptidoglycan-binding domain
MKREELKALGVADDVIDKIMGLHGTALTEQKLPKYGADGDYGGETTAAVAAFQKANGLTATGQADEATLALIIGTTETPVAPADPMKPSASMSGIRVTGGTVNIRSGPGTEYVIIATVRQGDVLPHANPDGWHPVLVSGKICWISGKMAEVAD